MTLVLLLAACFLFPAGCGIFGGSEYRLRGNSVIHRQGCPLLKHAQRGGIVRADSGDGPPCHVCQHDAALDWARDPD